MTEELLPPLTAPQRALLALMYRKYSMLTNAIWTHFAGVDGLLDFAIDAPRKTSVDALLARSLIAPRPVTEREYGRGAYTKAYEITPAGRAAHEALQRAASGGLG